MEMPSFNIFILNSPDKKSDKEQKKSKLKRALEEEKESMKLMEILSGLQGIKDEVRMLPHAEHQGGGP